jgi:hypothetical protein
MASFAQAEPQLRDTLAQLKPADGPMMVAAPPSKSAYSGVPQRDRPGRVTLSKEECQIARISGISLEEYAQNKMRMQAEIRAGYRQND